MTTFRPSSVAGQPETATLYPADSLGGPLAWSDDVTASSYVLFRGILEGKRSAAVALFDALGETPSAVEVRLYVEPQTSGTNLQVSARTLDDSVTLFDVNPLWGSGGPSPTPTIGALTWVSTGSIAVTGSAFAAGDFYIRVENRSSSTGVTADVYVYEMELVTTVGAPTRLLRRPLRQFPRSDGLGMSSARRQDANRSMQASLRRGGGVYF